MAAPTFGGDEVNALVVDIGSHQCKAGYAGEDAPKVVFGTAVGEIPEDKRGAAAMDIDPPHALQQSSPSQLLDSQPTHNEPSWKARGLRVLKSAHTKPIDHQEVLRTFQNGEVVDWDRWDTIVDEALCQQLHAKVDEHPLLFAESSCVSKDAREKAVEHLFEGFRAPAVFLAKNAVLSSFALGRQTSLVLDMGYESTTVAAVHDGYVLNSSVLRSPIAGRLLDECLLHCLHAKEVTVHPWYMFSKAPKASGVGMECVLKDLPGVTQSHVDWARDFIISDIKESHCRVNEQAFVEEENLNMPVQSYELPDGSNIDIGVERFKIPEILFNPLVIQSVPGMRMVTSFSGQPPSSIPEMVIESVNKTDVDIRKELLGGVVLTGGSSLFMSTKERLDRELLELAPQNAKVKVTTHQNNTERKFSVWLGGSILGSLGSFHQLWMSKQEYEEHGAGLIHRKSP